MASTINISGRQRMLSQRMLLLTHKFIESDSVDERTVQRQAIYQLSQYFESAHKLLTKNSSPSNISLELDQNIQDIYFSPPNELHLQTTNFIIDVRQFINTDVADISSQHPSYIRAYKAANGTLLESLDNVVLQLQINGESEISAIRRTELLVWLGTLIALGLEVLFIFKPMTRMTSKVYGQSLNDQESLETKLTELSNTQDELIESEKIASLGRMVAGFSHELNTPIGIILGVITSIQTELNALDKAIASHDINDPNISDALETIDELNKLAISNITRANNLVSGLKKTSIDIHSQGTRKFWVEELIKDTVFSLSSKLKNNNILLNNNSPKDLQLEGQPGLIELLLTNFILNSLIHGFDEDYNNKEQKKISINIEYINDDHLKLTYSDNGKGMSNEVVQKITEPFFTSKRSVGTGLGMYLCYTIITKELKGTLACESEVNKGASFTVLIPTQESNGILTFGSTDQ